MASCLGIYIDETVIKYAKVSKDHNDTKIEAYGIKFYDNLEKTINQIIEETYSYKIPTATNTADEQYTYIDMFSLLNKKDLQKATETEFELFCNENGKNKAAIEYRTIQVPNLDNEDKTTNIYTYINKSGIISRLQELSTCNVSSITPTALAIPMVNKFASEKNSIIVNIEAKTTITTIVDGKVYRVDSFDNGMKKVLDDIAVKENSLQKAYEICKNATIYTMNSIGLQDTENENMAYIMPVLYNIVEETKNILARNKIDISNIYITGMATAINNVDLYFQESFVDKKCEILTPYFVDTTNLKFNIKDYIEVNSAIALALSELNENEINFKKKSLKDKMNAKNNKTAKPKKEKVQKINKPTIKLNMDLGTKLDATEMWLLRTTIGLSILFILFSTGSIIISRKIDKKKNDVNTVIADTQSKIDSVKSNTQSVNSKINVYETYIKQMEEARAEINEYNAYKNAIPILLKNIQSVIPNDVQVLSIENPTNKNIKIKVQSEKYEQLGFFISKLKEDGILINITSDSGIKNKNVIQITIQGELPVDY